MNALTCEILLEQARIESVLLQYATALDERDWPALERVFTPDAVAHYSGVGEFNGREAVIEVISSFLETCGSTQHLLGNIQIQIDGEKAQTRCYVQATHAGIDSFQGQTMTVWGEYLDRLERRLDGWRIVHRTLNIQHIVGNVGAPLRA